MMNHTDLNQTVGLVGGIVFLIENLSSVLPYTLLMVFGVTAGLIGMRRPIYVFGMFWIILFYLKATLWS